MSNTKTIMEDIQEKIELGYTEEQIQQITGWTISEIRKVKEKMQ